MARKIRVEYPGALYHVMNRGDRREPIFRDSEDRQQFIRTLAEACTKSGWQVHALCLMRNHFHLMVETPRGNLVAGMKWFLGTYTGRFNRRHKLFGHLFSGRYKALSNSLAPTACGDSDCGLWEVNSAGWGGGLSGSAVCDTEPPVRRRCPW